MTIQDDILKCEDIKELRKLTIGFYKKNLADISVENAEIGTVKFSKNGYSKPISCSSHKHKLKVFPFLREIVTKGKLVERQKDKSGNHNNNWFVLEAEITVDNSNLVVRVNIRQDANGKLYYDHAIKKPLSDRASPQNGEPD
jgi:hypothetical protein